MEKYKEYIGKKYNYENKNIEIKKIKNISGNIVITTDVRTFAFYENEIDSFFNKLKPTVNIVKDRNIVIKKDNNDQDEMKRLLFETIYEVKKNKDYVKQANAICNITTQLINIKKIELLKK